MVVMALDHANTFIARSKGDFEMWADQFPLYFGDGVTFLTRLLTHPAAPGFSFLLGVGMVLLASSRIKQGWNRWRIAGHLAVRGALLILLQFLVENPAWDIGGPRDKTVYFGVLYSLGGTLILGNLLLLLPGRWLPAAVGASLILATQVLLPETRTGWIQYPHVRRLLQLPGYTPEIFVLYPLMPWLGVAGLGMGFGRWLEQDRDQALRWSLALGAAGLLIFVPLRLMDGIGNIRPMMEGGWIGFFNLVKYPPSITFLLLTLGLNLTLLGLFVQLPDRVQSILQPLAVFGRVPLFFYLTHLYLYGYLGQWINPHGVGIPRMLPFWLLGLLVLFPFCWLYDRFKHRQSPNSIWRFF
jgi:uncharacterized membrane protein